MPKALVTGASGFIGSTLITHLKNAKIEARALLRKTSSTKNLEDLEYETVYGSIEDKESLEKAVEGVDYVFHLAGIVSASKEKTFFDINTAGTERLVEACLKKAPDLRRFVYASSIAAAGPAKSLDPVTEKISCPVSAYGKSKAEAEAFLQTVKDKLQISIVRPPIVYGPKDTEFFHVVKSIHQRFVPMIRGENESRNKYYSSVHVDDLCVGMLQAAAQRGVPSGEIFFIAGDGIMTYLEIIDSISNSLERKAFKVFIPKFAVQTIGEVANFINGFLKKPLPINRDKVNELLPDYWICSNQKAKEMLGYEPKIKFHEGMKDTIHWYREKDWIK